MVIDVDIINPTRRGWCQAKRELRSSSCVGYSNPKWSLENTMTNKIAIKMVKQIK